MSERSSTSGQKSACIAAYDAAGFVLFPLKSNRAPEFTGWQKVLETPPELPNQYGWLIPSDCFVFDFDPRNGADQWDDFLLGVGLLHLPEDTLMIRTPRGGLHVYFKKRVGEKLPGHAPGYKAIEIKQKGQYVVAAGSHVKTPTYEGDYTVISGSIENVTKCPLDIWKAIQRVQPLVVQTDKDGIVNSEAAQAKFIKYLENVDTSQTAFVTACQGKDYGLSSMVIARLMFDHLNPRWAEPATLNELLTRAQNAHQFGQNAAGSKDYYSDFSDVELGEIVSNAQVEVKNGHGEEVNFDDINLHEVKWEFEKGGLILKQNKMMNMVMFMRLERWRISGSNKTIENPIKNLIGYNQFTERITFLRRAPWHPNKDWNKTWHDSDAVMLKALMFQVQHYHITVPHIEEAITICAHQNAYHPIRDYLNSLKWDGVKRLDKWLSMYCGAKDNQYVSAAGTVTLIGAVARVFEPGCQHDTMLILEGKQNAGKTSICRILGGEWSAEIMLQPENPKANVEKMLGKWIVELPEMEFTRHNDIKAVKAFLSIGGDDERLSYERHAKDYKRQSVFIGTCNPDKNGYFRDVTGNRRFLPVAVHAINLTALRENRDQLFAEAVVRYREKERHYLYDHEVMADAENEQKQRMFHEIWEDVIQLGVDNYVGRRCFTTHEIASEILRMPEGRIDQKTCYRINYAMSQLGYVQALIYHPGYRKKMKQWYKPGGLGELEL